MQMTQTSQIAQMTKMQMTQMSQMSPTTVVAEWDFTAVKAYVVKQSFENVLCIYSGGRMRYGHFPIIANWYKTGQNVTLTVPQTYFWAFTHAVVRIGLDLIQRACYWPYCVGAMKWNTYDSMGLKSQAFKVLKIYPHQTLG